MEVVDTMAEAMATGTRTDIAERENPAAERGDVLSATPGLRTWARHPAVRFAVRA